MKTQSGDLDDPAILTETGWYLYDVCHCGGYFKYKYRHKKISGFELQWFPARGGFKVSRFNMAVIGFTRDVKMTEIINQILQDANL